jgi:hypothetical protein
MVEQLREKGQDIYLKEGWDSVSQSLDEVSVLPSPKNHPG